MHIHSSDPTPPIILATSAQMRENIRQKSKLKGRQVDDAALKEVLALIGVGPYRRDLLIEYLHQLNDANQGLHEKHLLALAKVLKLSMAEVYEVASFYHHFEVLRDGQTAAALTIRVCDGLSCELAGAQTLLERLPTILGAEVRVISAPCVGRCEQAPVAMVHQYPVPFANGPSVAQIIKAGITLPVTSKEHLGLEAYRAQGGYVLLERLRAGDLAAETS